MPEDVDARLADLLARAEERDRLDQERRRRHDALEALLPAIAEALDVREVFPRLSALIQGVIPHVTVSMALVTPDGGGVKVHVASNWDTGELPEYRFTAESGTIGPNWRAFLAYDCEVIEPGVARVRTSPPGADPAFVELRPGLPWTKIASDFGLRSMLRVPIRVKREAIGGMSFGSDRPDAY